VDVLTPEMGDALELAGCDDATSSSRNGVVSVAFDRESSSIGAAIDSAIENVERAGYQVAEIKVAMMVGAAG
jgi:hypothetical protein